MLSPIRKIFGLTLLVALAGCGEDDSPQVEPGAADASTSTPVVACENKSAKAAGVETRSITVSGVARSFELSIPADYDPAKPARLVFGWHGLGGNGALLQAYTSVEGASAAAAGNAASIFAYPDGLVDPQFGATAWKVEDADLYDAIVDELSSELCIDSSRIFSYGHSFGGYFSNVLGCLRGNSLRAIAPVAGGLLPGLGTCDAAMPVWLSHAADDGTVPVSEGQAARDRWISENQCAQTSVAVDPSPCQAYEGCTGSAKVVWCETATGGHGWPSYANAAIWAFFASFDGIAP